MTAVTAITVNAGPRDDIQIGSRLATGEPYTIPETLLRQHSIIFGGSGYGKSYFSYLLIREQLKRGASLVALDPKIETIHRLRGACQEAGMKPERVTVIDARQAEFAPALNPFRLESDPAEVVAQLMELMDVPDNAGRMRQFLRNALTIAAWHGIALEDVPRLLYDDPYRRNLLKSAPYHTPDLQYKKSARFFNERFLNYSDNERESSILAVENKFDELLGNALFLSMFNADKSDIQFADLFREPGAVLASMGKGGGMTPTGRRLLGALLVQFLESASINRTGNLPVVLAIDEIGTMGKLIDDVLSDIVNMARERNIRLLVATQHPGQLSATLGDNLMESTAVKAYFRPGGSSVEETAKSLKSQTRIPLPDLLPVPVHLYQGQLFSEREGREHEGLLPLVSDYRTPTNPLLVDPDNPGAALRRFARFALDVVPPIYLENGWRAAEVFADCPPGSVELLWKGRRGYFKLNPPPPPAPPTREEWESTLRSLEQGQAVVITGSENPEVVRIAQISPRPDADAWYVDASRERFRRTDSTPLFVLVEESEEDEDDGSTD